MARLRHHLLDGERLEYQPRAHGEKWLTELSTEELRQLLELGDDILTEEASETDFRLIDVHGQVVKGILA